MLGSYRLYEFTCTGVYMLVYIVRCDDQRALKGRSIKANRC